jgi:hypothetical protein
MHALTSIVEARRIASALGCSPTDTDLSDDVKRANAYANTPINQASLDDSIWCRQMPISASTKLRDPRETIHHWYAETARVQRCESGDAVRTDLWAYG